MHRAKLKVLLPQLLKVECFGSSYLRFAMSAVTLNPKMKGCRTLCRLEGLLLAFLELSLKLCHFALTAPELGLELLQLLRLHILELLQLRRSAHP